jgi:glycosyltransferase involved in cell wall biosynthesis
MKKILGLCGDPNGVSTYRIIRPMEKIGADLITNTSKEKLVFGEIVKTFEKYDVVIIKYILEKELAAELLAAKCQAQVKNPNFKLYVDIDDDVFAIPKSSKVVQKFWTPDAKIIFKFFIRNVDGLICSTQNLADKYKKYNPNVHVVPNKVIPSQWARKTIMDGIRIGWTFSMSHVEDIPAIREALQIIHKKYPEVILETTECLIGGVTQPIKGVPFVKFHEWLPSRGWDIAIAPLKDNIFNKGKSNIKWLESTMSGSAFVCSDVETYKDVENGVTGLKCKTTKQWVEALSRLIEDRNLRNTLWANAKAEVEKNWSVESDTSYVNLYNNL